MPEYNPICHIINIRYDDGEYNVLWDKACAQAVCAHAVSKNLVYVYALCGQKLDFWFDYYWVCLNSFIVADNLCTKCVNHPATQLELLKHA